jgi:hypothetical protein
VSEAALREQLSRLLDWDDAHAGFEAAIRGLPADLRGVRPAGLPYSAWQLLEHMRLAQRDILEFCLAPEYHERAWPAEYWPISPGPADEAAWEASAAGSARTWRRCAASRPTAR